MIIKSMARKTMSFGQLIEYMSDIEKSDEQYNVYQNLYSRKQRELEAEFLRNSKLMRKRKNGNFLYHEILSITKTDRLTRKKQKEILRNIAYRYAQERASQNLVFGALHDDHEEHLHYHLLISANALEECKRTRLSKKEFDKLKKNTEARVLEEYPELEQKVVINKEAGEKLSKKGAERKRRTGETPQRDNIKTRLQHIFRHCKAKEDFFAALNRENLELYVRGKTIGIKDLVHDRNHRLKTLGLLDEFQTISECIELNEKQAQSHKNSEETQKNDNQQTIKQQQLKHQAEAEKIQQELSNDEDTQESQNQKKNK